MGILGTLFGTGKKTEKIKEMMANGAIIIDVRSPSEFKGGHIAGSQNIPLQQIEDKAAKIKKTGKPIIACCASGMRSAQATGILSSKGIEVFNGGAWSSLQSKLD